MAHARHAGALVRLGLSWLLIASFGGCQTTTALERAGVSLTVPKFWEPADPLSWKVPGTPLAAWSGPEGSSLVIYQTLPDASATAGSIAEALANRLLNLPGLVLRSRQIETLAGRSAARLEVVAAGSGAAFAPSGAGAPVATEGKPLVPTHQVTVGFPRSRGTLFLSWHTPEQAHDRIAPEIQAMLQSLKLTADNGPSTSHY